MHNLGVRVFGHQLQTFRRPTDDEKGSKATGLRIGLGNVNATSAHQSSDAKSNFSIPGGHGHVALTLLLVVVALATKCCMNFAQRVCNSKTQFSQQTARVGVDGRGRRPTEGLDREKL